MSETPSGSRTQRVALVTGAAGGLGREFAAALAARGHRVAGLDLADMAGTAELVGDGFHPLRADVTDPGEVAGTTGVGGGFERVRDLQVVRTVEESRDLVSTLLYVCDEASGLLTGQTINVDGGSAMH